MSYRTVIVYCRSQKEVQRLIQAVALLQRNNEPLHVTGLYVIPTPIIYSDANGFIDASYYETSLHHHQENALLVEELFNREITGHATTSEFIVLRTESESTTQTVNDFGMVADLIIAGQADPGDQDTQNAPVDQLVYNSKTPVLLIPYHFTIPEKISSLAIAFNGKYESSTAAFDALPLAKDCGSVKIVWVNAPKPDYATVDVVSHTVCDELAKSPADYQEAEIIPPASDQQAPEIAIRLQQAYQRHGITAEIDLIPSQNMTVQDRLRLYVSDNNIDVLIMGAYSQSRLRELIFGGVTRSFLENMPCMVLFSR